MRPNTQDRGRPRLSIRFAIQLLTLCFVLFAARGAWAQANAGISGTVTDASGAVIPDASVTITNEGTSVTSKTTTSGAGSYAVTGLTPGQYTVTVEKTGFKKSVQNHVNVEVTVTSTRDFTLPSGATTETVEVDAQQISLNTTQPQIGSTIEPTVVASLPNAIGADGRGRRIDQLQLLAPGTTGGTFSHRISGGVDFEQEILYNGVPAPQPETEGYTTNFNPPFEMVQEFRVERSTFSAQYGLGQGALTYQMASGTNTYHGDLFEINRNSFFDSEGFFNNKYHSSNPGVPTNHQNNYGFTVGGPVWIPKVYNGRDKTFGHLSMEWYKQNNEDTDVSTVPTALEKTGNFSDFVDGSTGALIPIFDPLTGKQFPGNIIPVSRFSPTSAALLQYIPNPDRPGSGIGGLDSNKSFAPFINPNINHVWGFTIDQNLNQRQSLHYSMWRNGFSHYTFDNPPLVTQPNPLNSMKYEPANGSGYLLTYNNTISPNLIMTAGAAWIGEINNQFNQTKFNPPQVAGGIIPPYIVWDGQHTLTKWGTQGSWLQSINRKLGIAIENNYLYTKGRNTFNFGIDIRRSYQDDNEDQTQGGQFSFSQRTTADPGNLNNTGSAFASFLLGQVDQANRSNSQELRLRNLAVSPYVQDDIKLTPKLTVNLGLRWDIQVPFTENNNLIVFFNPDLPNPAAGGRLGAATQFGYGPGKANFNRAGTHFGHFGPRLGFAYQVSPKMVVQGGFSVAFLNGGAYEYGTSKTAVNYGNLLVGSFTRLSSGTNKPTYGSWDATQLPNPQPHPLNAGLGVGTQINDFSHDDGFAPYSQQWNANVQRELGWNTFVQAAWVGNRVIHLPSQLNAPNQEDPKYLALGSDNALSFADGSAQAKGYALPYPNFVADFGGSATVAQSLTPYPQYTKIFNNFEGSGTTYYQALQVQVEKRFTNGLSFLAGYTLSRQYDNTSSGFSSFANGGLNKYNQRPEWAVSSSAPPTFFKAAGTYELPIGPGKPYLNNKGVTGQILGGWQVGFILDEESGTPTGPNANGVPFPNGFNRPNRTNGGLKTASYSKVADQFSGKIATAQIFSLGAFADTPSQYVLGDAKRNYNEMRNPANYNENVNVRKHFFFGERFQGILQVDYFNVLNRTVFQNPDNNVDNGTFGQVTGQGGNNQIGPNNRQGQASFRLEF